MNRFILEAMFARVTTAFAVLPFNANWMVSPRGSLARLAPEYPITVVDIGCRGGLPEELWSLRRGVRLIGFDADPAECARLNAERHGLLAREVHPVFIGGVDGETPFHLYRARGESSARLPDAGFAVHFAHDSFAVDETITVDARTLDSFWREQGALPPPDFIKLDAQGTEYEILEAASECLAEAFMVQAEVQFTPQYEGQALFDQVMALMRARDFELLHLARVFQQRKDYPGIAKGQLTFGDAWFVRRLDTLADVSPERLVRYALLLINYGALDLAHAVLRTHTLPDNAHRTVADYLRKHSGTRTKRTLRAGATTLIDKAALLLLHLRRHNGLRIDSDRSWPYR